MDSDFNHAANNSPRSGSSKHVTPMVWGAVLVVVVVVVIWFVMKM